MKNDRNKLKGVEPKTEAYKKSWALVLFGGVFAMAGLVAIASTTIFLGKGESIAWAAIIMGMIFTLIGGGIIWGGLKPGKANVSKSTMPKSDAQFRAPEVLKPETGGIKGRLLFTGLFTCIWFGVIFFAFFNNDSIGGFIQWVFVVFGLIPLLMTIHSLLSLFNPTIEVMVHGEPLKLGGSFAVNWEVVGKRERLKDVTISLIGQERATYQRGTDTHTAKHDFFEFKQVIGENTVSLGKGMVELKIPRNSMHTWDSTNNKVVWLLRVKGVISKWPNVNEEYPITIFPRTKN